MNTGTDRSSSGIHVLPEAAALPIQPRKSLLELCLANRIPLTHACGGMARCSTSVAIKRFRERVTRLLKAGGVQIGLQDLIVTRQGGAGYQLAPSLTIRAEVTVAAPGKESRKEATAEDRQKWFVEQLRKGKPLRRADLEEHFGVSLATAKRDLIALRPWVSFDRAEGAYRLRKSTPRA